MYALIVQFIDCASGTLGVLFICAWYRHGSVYLCFHAEEAPGPVRRARISSCMRLSAREDESSTTRASGVFGDWKSDVLLAAGLY